jgi:hypothetical protein
MTKQLYYYAIEPGDKDHLPAYDFDQGVVEAEPEEIAALMATQAGRHYGLLTLRPVQEQAINISAFHAALGGGLVTHHGQEVDDSEPCPEDAVFIDAYNASMG